MSSCQHLTGTVCLHLWLTSDLCPISREGVEERLRPITQLDLLFGLDKMKESKKATMPQELIPREVPLD